MSRCPWAAWNPIRNHPGLPFVPGVPMRGVLHSTEVPGPYRPRADGSYFGGASPPHFTVDLETVWQHVDTSLGAYALENRSGGVETNRMGSIQIEVMGRASDAPFWSDGLYAQVARLMRWIEADTGVEARYIDEGHPYPVPAGVYYGREPWRIGFADWLTVNCWVGHQHCPENSHGDPGAVRLDLLFPGKQGGQVPPRFTDFEEADMRHTLVTVPQGEAPFYVSQPRWDPGYGRPPTIVAVTVNGLVGTRCPVGAHVEGNAVVIDALTADSNGNPIDGFDVHLVVA